MYEVDHNVRLEKSDSNSDYGDEICIIGYSCNEDKGL